MDLPFPPRAHAGLLSEAIAGGCAALQQTRGRGCWHYIAKLKFEWVCLDRNQYQLETVVTHTTAIGAALLHQYKAECIAWEGGAVLDELARRTFPVLAAAMDCPDLPEAGTDLLAVLKALNDTLGWELERIVAWLKDRGL